MTDTTPRFVCELCDYSTNKCSSYDKHQYTWKHIRNRELQLSTLSKLLKCGKCGKVFKKKSWHIRHIAKCCPTTELNTDDCNTTHLKKRVTVFDDELKSYDESDEEQQTDANQKVTIVCEDTLDELSNGGMTNELLMTMMKYVRESEKKHGEHMEMMQKQLEEERNQCKMLMSTVKDMIPKIGSFNNNQISINIFLQEHCKDALNLKDFVESLRIELSDVSKFQDRSMIDAVGNVFVNGLRQLDLYKRPIHCMDLSRETLYIKDNDAWENDTVNKSKLSGAISAVAAKQSKVLQEWENLHPGWCNDERLTAEYLRLVRATTCPIERGSVSENKIIHNIAKEVVVDLRKVKSPE